MYSTKNLLLAALALLLGRSLSAQNTPQSDSLTFSGTNPGYDHHPVRGFVHDLRDVVIRPLDWQKKDYLKLGAYVGAAGLFYAYDQKIYQFVQDNKSNTTKKITANFLEPFGSTYSFGVIGAFAINGWALGNEKSKSVAIIAAESYVIAGLITQIPKNLAGRVRPENTNPLNSKQFNGLFGGTSFWSGHTVGAFAVASAIAESYNDKPYVAYISYGIASLTGLSRIHDEKHWPSDVFVGAVVGSQIGKYLVRIHRNSNYNLSFVPMVTPQGTTCALSLKF